MAFHWRQRPGVRWQRPLQVAGCGIAGDDRWGGLALDGSSLEAAHGMRLTGCSPLDATPWMQRPGCSMAAHWQFTGGSSLDTAASATHWVQRPGTRRQLTGRSGLEPDGGSLAVHGRQLTGGPRQMGLPTGCPYRRKLGSDDIRCKTGAGCFVLTARTRRTCGQ